MRAGLADRGHRGADAGEGLPQPRERELARPFDEESEPGGVLTSAILELLIYPVIYVIWRKRELPDQTEEATPLIPPTLIPSGWMKER